MLIDFNQHPDTGLNCDVCIVGGGAAGAVLFDILSRTKLKVILLESGGLTPDSETQKLNEGFQRLNGQQPKTEFTDLVWYRLRGLGGTTSIWGGGCKPFQKVDFSTRSWVKDSGWPIDLAELQPFYSEAKRYVEITSDVFDERLWSVLEMQPPYNINFDEISTIFSIKSGFLADDGYLKWSGPVNFKKFLANPDSEKSANLVLYNATLTDLKSTAGVIQYGEVINPRLQKGRIQAKIYVLAAGGWENPRILLNANRGAGIGNETDCVGRYYLGHPFGWPADLICPSKTAATKLFWKFQYYKIGRNRGQPHFAFKEATQRRHQLLSTGIWLLGDYDKDSAVYKAMHVQEQLRSGGLASTDISLSDAIVLLMELDDVLVNAFRKLTNRGVRTRMMEKIPLLYIQEGTPKRDSRIYLSKEKDKFGLKKLVLDWHFDEQEIQNMYKVLKLFAANARNFGWGRIQLRMEADVNSSNPTRGLHDAAHPSGATRMSDDLKRGVVDRNLRVHTVKNLYVCGSSVFPTNSYVSPTFTIAALAVRLAEHLKGIRI